MAKKTTIGVVIPNRGDPEIEKTIDSITDSTKLKLNFYVINDDKGAGTQASRHAGIMASTDDYIITTDAHMRFQKGTVETLIEAAKNHPDDIHCAKCHHQPTYGFDSSPYCGAAWVFKDENKFSEYHPVAAKWRTSNRSGIIGVVMGACYVFRRQRYLDIGAPWQYGTAWGKDEETISLINWLMGGESRLVNCSVSHLEQKPTNMPYKQHVSDIVGRVATRWRLIDFMDIPEAEKIEMYKWFQHDSTMKQVSHQVVDIIDTKKSQPLKDLLKTAPRSFHEWKAWWTPMKEHRKPYDGSLKDAPPKIIVPVPEPPKQTRTPRVCVEETGTACPNANCRERFDHTVVNTYSNKNRGVKCNKCGRHFIKFRKD